MNTNLSLLPYVGNGAYCYANSTSMLLGHIGESITPSKIEVLTGVGLSASLKKKYGRLYFNNQSLMPDLGISKALEILGFSLENKVSESEDDFPLERLKKDLQTMPVILGPMDMGYLNYNPRHKYLQGVDHYVFAYKIEGDEVFLHDPAGYPFVSLDTSSLKKAWQAKGIGYKKGFYRYITSIKRESSPSDEEVYSTSLEYFRDLYNEGEKNTAKDVWFVGKEAILVIANKISAGGLSEDERGHFIYFALPLGAKRALDFASHLDFKNKDLASIKREQARLFGEAHTRAVDEDWKVLTKTFQQLARVEDDFKQKLLSKK